MIITLITLLALILRLILANQSLWLDEGASWAIASLSPQTLISASAGDFHPPLYYLLTHYWLPFAANREWLMRLPGILIGTATISALYCLLTQQQIKKDKSKFTLAHLVALLLAINPLHIYYSQELRMYALSAFITVLTWKFFLVWIKKPTKKKAVFFIFSTLLNLFTFYGTFFNLAAQWIYLLFTKRKLIKSFLLTNLFLLLGFLPWLPTFWTQLQNGGYIKDNLPGWASLSGDFSLKSFLLIPTKFTLGRISLSPQSIYYAAIFLIVIYLGLLFFLALKTKSSRPFFYWLIIPLIIATLFSLKTPMMGYWRYIFLLPAFCSLIGFGLASLPSPTRQLNIALVIVVFSFSNLYFWLQPNFHREDWRSAAEMIQQSDSLVILNFPDAFAPFKFYLPDQPHFSTQDTLGHFRNLDESLPVAIDSYDHIFVLDYLSDLTDPQRQTLLWLNQAGLKLVDTHSFNQLGFVYEYKTP